MFSGHQQEPVQLSKIPAAEKHPLKCKWVMWYFKLDKSKPWSENYHEILELEFLEDFWVVYNSLLPMSQIPQGCCYSLFKQGIKPMWEDPRNVKGGRWLVNAGTAGGESEKGEGKAQVRRLQQEEEANAVRTREEEEKNANWLWILISLLGGLDFEEQEDQICGVTINKRPTGDRLEMWTSCAEDKNVTRQIGRKLYDVLDIPEDTVMGYQVHSDCQDRKKVRDRYSMIGGQFQIN